MINLSHLRYAIEVARTASITKAAQNLYMSQPNLSRAIKELEANLGIVVFKRSSNGIVVTSEGEEFLKYARSITTEVNELENRFRGEVKDVQSFSISVPRASYILYAFRDFVSSLSPSNPMDLRFHETNAAQTISNILESNFKLGIIRYQTVYNQYFKELLTEKGLTYKLVCEFQYGLLVSKESRLTTLKTVRPQDLAAFIEVNFGDPYVPYLSQKEVIHDELTPGISRHLSVVDRAGQLHLLSQQTNTFAYDAMVPQDLLDRYGLILLPCPKAQKKYRDILISRKDYYPSKVDKLFFDYLSRYKRALQ